MDETTRVYFEKLEGAIRTDFDAEIRMPFRNRVFAKNSVSEWHTNFRRRVLGRVDELFRNLTVAQDSILVGDEVPS